MIIHFAPQIDELNAACTITLSDACRKLMRASTDGNHLLVIKRNVCDWLIRNIGFSEYEKGRILNLKENFANRASILSRDIPKLTVEIGDRQLTKTGLDHFAIGHIQFSRSELYSQPLFLLEHMANDGDLYDWILNEFKRKQRIPNLCYLIQHGGGADTPDCFSRLVTRQTVLVSIVDSDQYAPCDTPSRTMRRLEREEARQTFVGYIAATPGREAENMIPLSLLEKHRRTLCPQYPSFELLREISERVENFNEIWCFFDVKKGIEVDHLHAINHQPVRDWLQASYSLESYDFSDLQLSGFGDNILRTFLGCGNALRDLSSTLSERFWLETYGAFFTKLAWYFAADPKWRGA